MRKRQRCTQEKLKDVEDPEARQLLTMASTYKNHLDVQANLVKDHRTLNIGLTLEGEVHLRSLLDSKKRAVMTLMLPGEQFAPMIAGYFKFNGIGNQFLNERINISSFYS